MITENLSTLKIHKLTKGQYEREVESGNVDETALYLTPDEEVPMEFNIEYLTAERWDGYSVYKKIINFGALPSSATKSVTVFPNMIADGIQIISFEGVARTSITDDAYITYTIPYTDSNYTIEALMTDGSLSVITTGTAGSGYGGLSCYGYFILKYIKNA